MSKFYIHFLPLRRISPPTRVISLTMWVLAVLFIFKYIFL